MDTRLAHWLGSVSKTPRAFVRGAFPWGQPGQLEKETGPETWQDDVLKYIEDGFARDRDTITLVSEAIQIAVASGHGVGKSCLVAWIVIWAISTCPFTRGVVTANTETQLRTKTWAELGKWFNLFIAKDEFDLTATALYHRAYERTWRIDMVPWSERNTEAFAGLHNKGSRILLIFDEGSAIPDRIYEVSEGALTDNETQIIWCVFGNPTRNVGRFRECFPGQRHSKSWRTYQVDSRTVRFTNKNQIARWVDAYGEDSDFVRVRVRGVFPRTGESEFISAESVDLACTREPISHLHDPLVLGVDVARYGSNETVIYPRKGRDASSIPPTRLRGASVVEVATRVSELYRSLSVDAVFVDGGGVGGGVVDVLRNLHIPCFDINFGSKAEGTGFTVGDDGVRYANKRAEMWGSLRKWLSFGSIPNLPELRQQLVGPTYTYNLRNEIQLEKKEDMAKRGLESPDLGDALALTFAFPVQPHANAGGPHSSSQVLSEYDPFSPERMAA